MTRHGPRVERGPPAGIIIVVASILAFLLWILVPLCASQAPTVGDKTSEEKTTGAATLGRSHQFDEDQNSKRRRGVHLTVRSFIKMGQELKTKPGPTKADTVVSRSVARLSGGNWASPLYSSPFSPFLMPTYWVEQSTFTPTSTKMKPMKCSALRNRHIALIQLREPKYRVGWGVEEGAFWWTRRE